MEKGLIAWLDGEYLGYIIIIATLLTAELSRKKDKLSEDVISSDLRRNKLAKLNRVLYFLTAVVTISGFLSTMKTNYDGDIASSKDATWRSKLLKFNVAHTHKLDSLHKEYKTQSDTSQSLYRQLLARSGKISDTTSVISSSTRGIKATAERIWSVISKNNWSSEENKPLLEFAPTHIWWIKGEELKPNNVAKEKFKEMMFRIVNAGSAPIENVDVTLSGDLGMGINDDHEFSKIPPPREIKEHFEKLSPNEIQTYHLGRFYGALNVAILENTIGVEWGDASHRRWYDLRVSSNFQANAVSLRELCYTDLGSAKPIFKSW